MRTLTGRTVIASRRKDFKITLAVVQCKLIFTGPKSVPKLKMSFWPTFFSDISSQLKAYTVSDDLTINKPIHLDKSIVPFDLFAYFSNDLIIILRSVL